MFTCDVSALVDCVFLRATCNDGGVLPSVQSMPFSCQLCFYASLLPIDFPSCLSHISCLAQSLSVYGVACWDSHIYDLLSLYFIHLCFEKVKGHLVHAHKYKLYACSIRRGCELLDREVPAGELTVRV